MKKLTRRQQQILDLIQSHTEDHGAPPTRAELARQLGLRAPSTVDQHLQALAAKGALTMLPGLNRNIRVSGSSTADIGLPLIGRVAAGAPILAEPHVEGRYRIDGALFEPRADYLLRVRGISMRDAGILDGDLLAVHHIEELRGVRNGQIVVARLDDEVTVKRLDRHQPESGAATEIRLLPDNPDFDPIIINPARHEFNIEGVAVGVIRNGRF